MDRHLTYVGMTRHREQAALYAGGDDFETYEAMAWRGCRASGPRKRRSTSRSGAASTRVRDWIENGRALLNRAQARFERAIAHMGERLGLGARPGGRSFRSAASRRRCLPQGRARRKLRRQKGLERLARPHCWKWSGRPLWRRNSRACGRRRSASWRQSKSGKPRWPKNSQRSTRPSQPGRADFLPYFQAPRRAMKSGIPNGRGSGTYC